MDDLDFDSADVASEDAIAVGRKVIEAAQRAKVAHAALPGCTATWCFDIDEVHFQVRIAVLEQVEG
jgi:hypothetical protein